MSVIAKTWHKSSYSKAETNCVEAAYTTVGGTAVRDTQNRERGHLSFAASEWSAFVAAVKREEFGA